MKLNELVNMLTALGPLEHETVMYEGLYGVRGHEGGIAIYSSSERITIGMLLNSLKRELNDHSCDDVFITYGEERAYLLNVDLLWQRCYGASRW